MTGPNNRNDEVEVTETDTEEVDIESGGDHGTPQTDPAHGTPQTDPGHGTPQTIRRS